MAQRFQNENRQQPLNYAAVKAFFCRVERHKITQSAQSLLKPAGRYPTSQEM